MTAKTGELIGIALDRRVFGNRRINMSFPFSPVNLLLTIRICFGSGVVTMAGEGHAILPHHVGLPTSVLRKVSTIASIARYNRFHTVRSTTQYTL